MNPPHTSRAHDGTRIRNSVVVIAFLAIAVFFLWEEHKAHLLGALPLVLLALCPLLHVFMHRGHGGSHGDHPHDETPPTGGMDKKGSGS